MLCLTQYSVPFLQKQPPPSPFGQFLACTAVSLILGLLIAAVYRYKSECTKSFAVTLVLMPVIVQMVIMLVNGNLGTGVP